MRILVSTDFSTHADMALALVKGMSLPAGSKVRLVHAVEPVTTVAIFAPADLLVINETTERALRALLRDQAKTLEAPGLEADAAIGFGRAADVVIEESESFAPDLIVVGSRGRGGVASNVLGSVSAEIVDRSHCPVLVARRQVLSSIVLADDGSADAAAGAACIAELPPLATASVHVVSVVDVPFPIVLADPAGPGTAVEAYRAYEEAMPKIRATQSAIARDRAASLQRLGVRATDEMREGDPAAQLLLAAQERSADCIVIGSRGQTGLRRLFLGSVARNVLFHAPCSVLIAHVPTTSARKDVSHDKESVALRA